MTNANTIQFKPADSSENNWKKLVDLIYPVGTYYITKEPTSPASLFGGTWTRIKEKFLLADYNENLYSLDLEEDVGGWHETVLPKHTHEMEQATYTPWNITANPHKHQWGPVSIDHSHYYGSQKSESRKLIGITSDTDPSIDVYLSDVGKITLSNTGYRYLGVKNGTNLWKDNATSNVNMEIGGETEFESVFGTPCTGGIKLVKEAEILEAGNDEVFQSNFPPYQLVHCWCRIA